MKILLNKILNYVLRYKFKALTEEDVFITNKENGIIYYKGKQIDKAHREVIAEDARKLTESRIWRLLMNECEYQASTKMFKTSGSNMDVLFGKAMLHTIKVLDTRLKQMKNL